MEEYDEEEEWDEDQEGDWEGEDWEEDDGTLDWSEAWDEDGDGEISAGEFSRTVSFGVLSMLPLFLGYEWALSTAGQDQLETRSMAEALLSLPIRSLAPSNAALVRTAGVGIIALYALVSSYRRGAAVLPKLVRVLVEGAVAGVLLGPILALTSRAAEPYVGAMMMGQSADVPELRRAAFVMGGAAFEELLFRVIVVAIAFLVVRRGAGWMGMGGRLSSLFAAVTATAVSAMLFAFSHTEIVARWMGGGGEPWDPALFTWRAASAVLLTAIVFWRGVGVAAWAHAFFNLSLLIGIHPPALL